jgi:hypothetical protein
VGFLLFPRFEAMSNAFTRVLAVIGSAPMFFYIFHLYVLLAMQMLMLVLVGPNYGQRWELDQYWPVWLISLALVPVMYYPTRAFAAIQADDRQGVGEVFLGSPWTARFRALPTSSTSTANGSIRSAGR